MVESFENLDHILHDWARDNNKKSIVEALNSYEKDSLAGKRKIKPFSFLKKWHRKKVSSSPLSSETKPNRKLVLVSREPLLNKPNKQNVFDSFNKFNNRSVGISRE